MKDFEKDLVVSFKSYKLDRAADEVLAELKKANVDSILNLAASTFKVASGSASGVPPIPAVLSTLLNAYKSLMGINDYYKLKKHIELFVRLDEVKAEDRIRFATELESNPDFREQFCATVYMLVDRVSELDKIIVISNLIIARNERKIDNETFFRMMHIVDKLNWYELFAMYLSNCPITEMTETDRNRYHSVDNGFIELLMENNGLVQIKRNVKADTRGLTWGEGGKYSLTKNKKMTEFGKQFLSSAFRGFKYKMYG